MIDNDTLKSIEDLHRLKNEGIITDEEFERSKEKLLFGTRPAARSGIASMLPPPPSGLPARDDHFGWITLPVRRYAEFQGRSTRKEFWMFQLLPLALFVVAFMVAGGSADEYGEASAFGKLTLVLAILAFLGLLVPMLAVQVRRMHDQDRSGWFVLLNFIPYVGAFVVLVLMLLDGTKGENRFGPDPRQG